MKDNLIEKLKSGDVFPDKLFGWSTKTVLAGLLALIVLKLKFTASRKSE